MTQNCIKIMFRVWKRWKKQLLLIFHQFWDKKMHFEKKSWKNSEKKRKMLNFRNFWPKINWKIQNFTSSNMVQKCIEMFFRTSKSLQNVFLMIFRQIWTKKNFWKKSFKNAWKYRKNQHFWAKHDQKIRKYIFVKNDQKLHENSL